MIRPSRRAWRRSRQCRKRRSRHCGPIERFKNVRRTGTITALELEARDAGYLAGIGPKLLAFFGNRGLLLRPLGNTIYVMPPYCVTQADLDEIYAAIAEAAHL